MVDTPRLTPPMRALLECAGCLAHTVPIPVPLLLTATDATRNREMPLALRDLITIGFMRQIDKESVLLTAEGHRFLADRPRGARTRDAVELAILLTANPLIEAEDNEGLAFLVKHLAAVVEAALPRADEKAAMLASTFVICLLQLEEIETLRYYLPQIRTFQKESGYAILPDRLAEKQEPQMEGTVTVTAEMYLVLQCLQLLDVNQPLPVTLLYATYQPQAEMERAIDALIACDYLTAPITNTILLTDLARQARLPVEEEIVDALASGFSRAVQKAVDENDQTTLRNLQPHVDHLLEAPYAQTDELRKQLLLTMTNCLVGLNEPIKAAIYLEQAKELEAALGQTTASQREEERGEQALQYHAQVAMHYFQEGEFGRAQQHLEQAIALTDDPAHLPLFYQKLGDCCGTLGDIAGKINAYLTAMEYALAHHGHDSWHLIRHRNDLALLLIETGDLNAAAAQMQEALWAARKNRVDDPHYYKETAKAHLLMASVAYQQNKHRGGKKHVEKASTLTQKLNQRPVDQVHLLYMGASLLYQHESPQAAKSLISQAYMVSRFLTQAAGGENAIIIGQIADLYQKCHT